ncbi:hypothetical protein FRB94_002917 [Tulasnella sp. JGI-2019a]|nr:hypothetical protein FRB93_013936 [Tulasnella sp. JGI-2019a]KAG9013389.1 hypothetical protein FRB94_002917 [Tulasnella sp. JGI-2019a]KAG9033735.1 hypothetical protein FRB95_014422 [Tulasnella sp. JGI-2019a]
MAVANSNSFPTLHDHCRVKKIPMSWTDVWNGPQDAPEWISTVTLFDASSPKVRHFTGHVGLKRKKDARNLAAERACEYLGLEVPASTSGSD